MKLLLVSCGIDHTNDFFAMGLGVLMIS